MFTVDELNKRKMAEKELDPTGHGIEHRGQGKKRDTVFHKETRTKFGPGSAADIVEKLVPIGELRKYLSYDPEAGVITRIRRVCDKGPTSSKPSNAVPPSVQQFGRNRSVATYVVVGSVYIHAPHCAWYLMTGKWEPNVYLVDGQPENIKESNLTLVKPDGYGAKCKSTRDNSSLFPEWGPPCASS